MNNNPIISCIKNEKCDNNNILFFTNSSKLKENKLDKESNIFDLLLDTTYFTRYKSKL